MFKKKVSDILPEKLISVGPATPVSQVLRTMQEHGISCVVIVDEQARPVGIFTERSIVQYVAAHGLDFSTKTIDELMSGNLLTNTRDAFLYEVYNRLMTYNIRHMVIVDDERKCCGVITQSDIIRHIGSEYFVDVKKISQVMSKWIFIIRPEAPVLEALQNMAKRSISCMIVAINNKPVGVLTERDISRVVSQNITVEGLKVEDVMSTPVITVDVEMPVYEAARIIQKKRIRRLVIVDGEGLIEGLTTQSDIIRGLEGRYTELLNSLVTEKDSELRKTLQELHEKTTHLNNILRSSVDMGIISADLDFKIAYFNPAAARLLELHDDQLLGQDVRRFFPATVVEREFKEFDSRLDSSAASTVCFDVEKGIHKKVLQVRISGMWDQNDTHVGYVCIVTDITVRRMSEETIRYMAYHDNLTDLPNRVLFNDRLVQELAQCTRNESRLALMVLDLDKFKMINDTYGHQTGDELLRVTATRLKSLLRASDSVARMGGDEFLILLPDVTCAEDAREAAERIIENVERPLNIDGTEIKTTASIGVSFYPSQGVDPEALLKEADRAMYMAKDQNRSNGGSNFIICAFTSSP